MVKMFTNNFRRRITTILSVWMTVASLGVCLSHAHTEGSSPHSHGYGLNFPANPLTHTNHSEGTREPHCHLILFGLEFPVDHCPHTAFADLGIPCTDSVVNSDCDSPPSQTAIDITESTPPVAFVSTVAEFSRRSPIALTPVSLSAFARHDVAGVLRL